MAKNLCKPGSFSRGWPEEMAALFHGKRAGFRLTFPDYIRELFFWVKGAAVLPLLPWIVLMVLMVLVSLVSWL